MDVTFPGESAEYRAARNELLAREIELRRQTEAVAAARRELLYGPWDPGQDTRGRLALSSRSGTCSI